MCMCILCFSGKFATELHAPEHDYFVVTGSKLEKFRFGDQDLGNVLALIDSTRRFSVGSWREVSIKSKIDDLESNERVLLNLYYHWKSQHTGMMKTQERSPMNVEALEQFRMIINKSSRPTVGSDMPGYIDRRCDFDVEYDDSAELIVADLEITEEDSLEDRAQKLDCLRQLTSRLDRRDGAKEFARGNKLPKIQHQIDSFRSRTAEEADIHGKTRPLRRFFDSSIDADAFNQIILYERRLRARIAALEGDRPCEKENRDTSVVSAPISTECERPMTTQETDDRPQTRSKSQLDNRRLKLAESEMTKILDIISEGMLREGDVEVMSAEETSSLGSVGFPCPEFALLKGSILKKIHDSQLHSVGVSVMKFGDTYFLKAQTES